MKTLILLPGKIKPKALTAAQDEYVRRLKTVGIETAEYRDEKVNARQPEQAQLAEADRILKQLKDDDFLAALDERGKAITTRELADWLQDTRQGSGKLAGKRRAVLVIGGAHGLHEKIRTRADAVWSLSSLVMAGGVARIVLLEALYRAAAILDNHPYHNE